MDEVLIAKLLIQGMKGIDIRSGVLCNCMYAPSCLSIPFGVVALRAGCLSGQSDLERVTLPVSITQIGYGVFANCAKLKLIRIPRSLEAFKMDLKYGNKADLIYVSGIKL